MIFGMILKNKLLLVAATALSMNAAVPVAQVLEKTFNCVGKASLKDGMPRGLSSELKMLLTLLTPIEFNETFHIKDALIEGAKIEISASKITLAQPFYKKIGEIDTHISQMEINRSTGAFYLAGEMTFQGSSVEVAAHGKCAM